MTVQDPQIRLGWLTLSTTNDARRSSITGTTLNGPNGSAQFYWVYTSSTCANFQVFLGSSAIEPSTAITVVGILQDTPAPGMACSICTYGVTKAISGSTSLAVGGLLQVSSTSGGQVTPYVTGNNGRAYGYALEAPTTVGQVFSIMFNSLSS